VTVAVVLLLSLCIALPAGADSALQPLRVGIDRVFHALGDPALDGKAGERRHVIHGLTQDLFDWMEMGQRLLGSLWEERTDSERVHFVALLARMIDAHVLALAPDGGDTIVWKGETIAGGLATIRTTMMKRGRPLTLDYRVILRDDRWRVYDVAIDDVSLLGSYRAQFRQIIKTSSYEALVDTLRQ
jgi:phospholipid transport system substrate-binding protein